MGQESIPRTNSNTTNDIITCKIFGNKLEPKKKNLFRCATHNINNMPELGWVPKSKEITAMATGKDGADIRMWQEIGLYWPKVEETDKWGKRLRGRGHGIKSVFSFNSNEHEITSARQPGGTAIITNTRLSSRFKESGTDPRKLGRWAWIRCGDDKKVHTTFISVYRPCLSSTGGCTTTYEQHRHHIPTDKEPRKLLLEDLTDLTLSFQAKGDNIVIDMDANQDINSRQLRTFMNSLNLKNSVFAIHGNNCPSTTDTR